MAPISLVALLSTTPTAQYAVTNGTITDTSLSLPERIRRHRSALDAEELAEILDYAVSTVYKMAKKGQIPSYRIGGSVKFDPALTADWLEGTRIM